MIKVAHNPVGGNVRTTKTQLVTSAKPKPNPKQLVSQNSSSIQSAMVNSIAHVLSSLKLGQPSQRASHASAQSGKLDDRLLRQLPLVQGGLLFKKRKRWIGFQKRRTYVALKSGHLLIYKSGVKAVETLQVDSPVFPKHVLQLAGCSVEYPADEDSDADSTHEISSINSSPCISALDEVHIPNRSLDDSVVPRNFHANSVHVNESHESISSRGRCDSVQSKDPTSNAPYFEFTLKLADGTSRVFATRTAVAREAWVRAIRLASIQVTPSNFVKLAMLGKGHFGKVYLAVHKNTGAMFALKELLPDSAKLKRLLEERSVIERISGINSRFLGKTMFSYRQPETHSLVYINQLYAGGDMWGLLRKEKRLDEDTTRYIVAQVVLGIQHLHDHGIVHRDLKLENVLFDHNCKVKLVDFGLSKVLRPVTLESYEMNSTSPQRNLYTRTFSVCGTNYYMPPEMLTGGHGHGLSTDWWQLGCLIYEALVGRPAFFEVGATKIHAKILAGPPLFPSKESVPIADSTKELILKFLMHNSTMRFGCNGVEEVMGHSYWGQGFDWEAVAQGKSKPTRKLEQVVQSALGWPALSSSNRGSSSSLVSSCSSEFDTELDVGTAIGPEIDSKDVDEVASKVVSNILQLFPDAMDLNGNKLVGRSSTELPVDLNDMFTSDSLSANASKCLTDDERESIEIIRECHKTMGAHQLNRDKSPCQLVGAPPTENTEPVHNNPFVGFEWVGSIRVLREAVRTTKALGFILPRAPNSSHMVSDAVKVSSVGDSMSRRSSSHTSVSVRSSTSSHNA